MSNGGWFASITDQLNQFKDVMTTETEYDEEYRRMNNNKNANGSKSNGDIDSIYQTKIDNNNDDDDIDDDPVLLRAEINKYKETVGEMEKKVQESEERIVSVSKEFGSLMIEKQKEMDELKSIIENLKNSIISPSTANNNNNNNIIGDQESDKVESITNLSSASKINNTNLGITFENDNHLVYEDQQQQQHQNGSNENEINYLKEQLKNQSENYQNEISTLQSLQKEKIYKLNHQLETLQEENELLKNQQDGKWTLISDNLKKQNESLEKELNDIKSMIINIEGDNQLSSSTSLYTQLKQFIELKDQEIKLLKESTLPPPTVDLQKKEEEEEEVKKVEDGETKEQLKEQLVKSTKELTRLRQYLIEVEENHTISDLDNEEKINQLTQKLKEFEEKSKNNSEMNQEIERLRNELNEKEDELKRSNVVISNLNSVLEQFQADQESAIQTELVGVNQKLKESLKEIEKLKQEKQMFERLKLDYADSQQTIVDLNLHLEQKSKELYTLREDIEPLKKAFDKNIMRLSDMCLQEQDSVDKRVVSKLFLNYFRGNKKMEVLALIAKILSFTEDEKVSIGLNKRQWSIPFFGAPTTPGGSINSGTEGDKSLTDMWIEFLLKEAGNDEQQQQPTTPFATPTKSNGNMAPPPSPSTPYRPTTTSTTTANTSSPVVGGGANGSGNLIGKLKSNVILDGDVQSHL